VPLLSYLRAINRAIGDEMDRDPSVFIMGEDIREALTNTTPGLLARFGPDRVVETPLSEQAFTNFATGAALAGMRPVVEYQIPFLLLLVLEQIANQANKVSVMSGGQASVPVTYLLPAAGWRPAWGGQHSDQPYTLFGHLGVKTVLPSTPADAYGLMVSAIRDDDPVVVFAPIGAHKVRSDLVFADLAPVPLGVGRVHRSGTDVTVLATGHLVHDALAVADELSGEVSIEVLDPRTIYPFDWDALFSSLDKTGRLVVLDDTNRFCGFAAEIIATVAEQRPLLAMPRRVTRPDSAVVGCAPELDLALQPSRAELVSAVRSAMNGEEHHRSF
jgi:pyruvate/2-oxoglutarate/acetoin dehydrogenase E1 component